MKNSRHAAHTSQLIAAGVGRGDHAADGKGALTPGGRSCGPWCPLGPPVGRALSNHPTGQTVTETEIISIIYGVYSIHCGDLME